MTTSIISSAQVPKGQYIERSADIQIRRIINDMARPGYVLVARQMGKTNLLLHAKDVLQTEKDIFVYVDFSTMSNFSERECLNHLIDTAIEINFDLFSEAEQKILELRKREGYNVARAFSRELRILLSYVNKIVFILDEIDALTRRDYSDRIFSLIRGHYYANTNFPELKKATFILSGVIEPKDIIKDPNISPFNIGEKIYLNDFTKDEFLRLANNSSYLSSLSDELINRLYYWCGGQPRMSWDICSSAEHLKVRTIEEIDSLVETLYLTKFDKAPIDSIREMVKSDVELRGALIQLVINKGDTLQSEIKSKLYLSGIINYKNTTPDFKNEIMRKSLSYDWLLSLSNGNNQEYISAAERCIELDKDYKTAINHLSAYINGISNVNNVSNNDDTVRAYYLLALAYQRNYNPEESLKLLNHLSHIKRDNKYYDRIMLLKACNYIALNEFKNAELILRELISLDIIDEKIALTSKIYLASVLTEQKQDKDLLEAEKMLLELLHNKYEMLRKHQLLSLILFNLAGVEAEKGNEKESVKYIDTALLSAQPNEKPRLLYFKLMHTNEKDTCAEELYNSLSFIKTKPEAESFDNPLALNTYVASLIIAEFMLHHKEYDVTKYLRQFLYDSKENAVIFIYNILDQSNDSIAPEFFHLIKQLTNTPEWQFQLSELINLSNIECSNFQTFAIANKVREIVNKGHESLPSELQVLYLDLISINLKLEELKETELLIIEYRNLQSRILNKNLMYSIFIDYLECRLNLRTRYFAKFEKNAIKLYNLLEACNFSDFEDCKKMRVQDIIQVRNQIEVLLRQLAEIKSETIINVYTDNNIGRNSKIRVRYTYDGHEEIAKYKHLKKDIDLGLCSIIEINLD